MEYQCEHPIVLTNCVGNVCIFFDPLSCLYRLVYQIVSPESQQVSVVERVGLPRHDFRVVHARNGKAPVAVQLNLRQDGVLVEAIV